VQHIVLYTLTRFTSEMFKSVIFDAVIFVSGGK
jgi:hypothetical protein